MWRLFSAWDAGPDSLGSIIASYRRRAEGSGVVAQELSLPCVQEALDSLPNRALVTERWEDQEVKVILSYMRSLRVD